MKNKIKSVEELSKEYVDKAQQTVLKISQVIAPALKGVDSNIALNSVVIFAGMFSGSVIAHSCDEEINVKKDAIILSLNLINRILKAYNIEKENKEKDHVVVTKDEIKKTLDEFDFLFEKYQFLKK